MQFAVPPDHPSLPGHFPGRPVVPGVVVLERVVEAIEAARGPLRALRLPQVKFAQPLLPGETAEVVLEAVEGDAPRWRFRVLREGATIASGEVVSDESVSHESAPAGSPAA
jgi:3-hydroxymyristoyl/3-hydroxydecanoyl-(acyl carrier protein) dehydratase